MVVVSPRFVLWLKELRSGRVLGSRLWGWEALLYPTTEALDLKEDANKAWNHICIANDTICSAFVQN